MADQKSSFVNLSLKKTPPLSEGSVQRKQHSPCRNLIRFLASLSGLNLKDIHSSQIKILAVGCFVNCVFWVNRYENSAFSSLNAVISAIVTNLQKINHSGQPVLTVSLIALSSFFNIFQHLTVLFLIKYDKFILIRFLQMGDFSNETKNCDSSRNLD